MNPSSLLVANRGEIAIRVLRAAGELGMRTVAVYAEDDAASLHTRRADEARALHGSGAAAYLDGDQILAVAKDAGCDAIHPGYGFLSENAAFARRCREDGISFVGPRVEMLELFGDKLRARATAVQAGVPVLPGTSGPASLEEAFAFFRSLNDGEAMIIKAVAGGGGRGVRAVERLEEIEGAYARCRSEALAAFGNGDVYVEQLVRVARHIEVQIVGDGSGTVSQLGERDCSIQRRHQKLVEIAPAPGLPPGLRDRITTAAVQLARAVHYDNIGTFEFLVDASHLSDSSPFAFIEANPRLQVEHTVTEEVTGLDLVRLQLELAGGASLATLGLRQSASGGPAPRGFAIQVRVNMETIDADGNTLPSSGTLTAFDPPGGPGIRVDTFGYAGYRTSLRYDSLLAKVIAHSNSPHFADAVTRCERALSEFRIDGVSTNIAFLQNLLQHPAFREARLSTRFIDKHREALTAAAILRQAQDERNTAAAHGELVEPQVQSEPTSEPSRAGTRIDSTDPLAVLAYGQASAARRRQASRPAASPNGADAEGMTVLAAPLQGTIVAIDVQEGETVRAGQSLLVMEAMKMEHEIRAERGGIVRRIAVATGDTIYAGSPLLFIEQNDAEAAQSTADEAVNLAEIRPDLQEVLDRRDRTRDAARPDAVARRRATDQRTACENIQDLCDPDSFVEYGPLVLAAQRSRRSLEELIVKSPADGIITGIGRINGDRFAEPASRCVVMSYDYTVFAGTQGTQNHRKTDRMIDVAEQGRMPVILFAEGGGGRPGDVENAGIGNFGTFAHFARLSGLVPLIGITSGRCFAGNASLLGCCDVIIATADSNIGMGGGLGVFAPEDIGPMEVQVPNGVVDITVADEAEAVRVAKRYLAYFQGSFSTWECADQRRMRRIVPENRLRVYNVRAVIETLADTGTVLELRPRFGAGMVTALLRVEGRPMGVIANNPTHLGGAIDADGADKAARFMQLCDAFDLPILFLCDTPGIMVGPEIEKTALVRHSSRMFLTGANLSVPFFTIVLRKAYGLGAIAMAGGSYKVPQFAVSWPTGEFWGMGIEGSVKLGYRAELAAIEDPVERRRVFDQMVAQAYERSKALNNASIFGIDDAIDPADSRLWVASLLRSLRPPPPRSGKKRPAIDAW